MQITRKDQKDLTSLLDLELTPKDYQDKVDKVLLDHRKKVVIPGFRKGKTPISLIRKKYYVSILVEEINKIIQNKLYEYIQKEKLQLLGSPMPKKNSDINWEEQKTFKFQYEIGLSPEITLKISKKDSIDYYIVQADSSLVDNYCSELSKRNGTMDTVDISEKGDLLLCNIQQLDTDSSILEDGISNEATVSMDFISDKSIKKKFIGVSDDSELIIDITKGFNNKTDLAALLKVDQKELENIELNKFKFTVKKISRMNPADLNQELFDKIYGKDVIKTLKEFREKIKEEAENNFIVESDRMFKNDVVNYILEKIKIDLPNDFLKRWLLQNSESSLSMEKIESEYKAYSRSLKWQLIENKILEDNGIEITEENLLDHTKKLIISQMTQYKQPDPGEKQLMEIAKNVLGNKEERKKIHNQVLDQLTLNVYKQSFKLKNKNISYNDFIKLASEKSK